MGNNLPSGPTAGKTQHNSDDEETTDGFPQRYRGGSVVGTLSNEKQLRFIVYNKHLYKQFNLNLYVQLNVYTCNLN